MDTRIAGKLQPEQLIDDVWGGRFIPQQLSTTLQKLDPMRERVRCRTLTLWTFEHVEDVIRRKGCVWEQKNHGNPRI